MFIPRPYQQQAVNAVRASWRAGHRSILLVAPTGSGKTALATMIGEPVLQKGKRVGFFVHREELQEQAASAFRRLGVKAGIIRAGAPRTSRQFQVVSIQTAARRDLDLDFDFAFLDEARHFVAPDWTGPIRKLQSRGCGIVGLDATPDRGDGRGLGEIFDDLIVVAQPRDLIKLGYLVPCRVVGPPASRKTLAEYPVRAYQRWAPGRRCVVFAASVDHARRLAGEFNAAGIRAGFVEGNMTSADRMRAISAFRRGALDVLCNCQILTEGFDVPNVSAIITTTGASSPGPLIQKVGRGMRPAEGKTDCIHLDLRGAWRELAMLPDEDREFSLDGRAITGTTREYGEAIVQCRGCGCWFRANEFQNSTCPECQSIRKGREDPRVRRARLQEVSQRMPQHERTLWLARKIVEGRGKRRKDGTPYRAVGWALQQYSVRFRRGSHPERPNRATIDSAVSLADKMIGKNQ